jgi:hypothetical protein
MDCRIKSGNDGAVLLISTSSQEGGAELRKCVLNRMQRIAPRTSIAPVKFEPWVERLRDGFLR